VPEEMMPVVFLLFGHAMTPVESASPLPFFYESLEGNAATIHSMTLAARLRSGKDVLVTLANSNKIEVRYFHARPITIIVDPTSFGSINGRDVRLLSTKSFAGLTLFLPYGPPMTKCFSNGEKVFARLEIQVAAGGVERVDDVRFVNCEVHRERRIISRKARNTYALK
jgi:hypothetical protein